jgi:hypothetical protein
MPPAAANQVQMSNILQGALLLQLLQLLQLLLTTTTILGEGPRQPRRIT